MGEYYKQGTYLLYFEKGEDNMRKIEQMSFYGQFGFADTVTPHYFTKTITNLIKNYGLTHSLIILNSCLSDDDGHTLSIFEVDETINSQYLKNE